MFGIIRLIVSIIFYIIETLLLIRFILVLFAANISGTFAAWIFANSASLIGPFKNIFPTVSVVGLSVDLTVLFALIIYVLIGQLIDRALYYLEGPRVI